MPPTTAAPHKRVLEAFRGRSFLSTTDFSRSALSELLDLAVQHKTGVIDPGLPLRGKAVALVFFNPSLRTRSSMTIAIQQLGGVPVPLGAGTETWSLEFRDGVVMDGDKVEHIKEAAPVLARYFSAIGVRCFPGMRNYEEDKKEPVLSAFREHCSVPIINLESSTEHPLQGLGDVLTIREKFGTVDRRKVTLTWAYHPRPLPVSTANSVALAMTQYGMDLTIACPPEYQLDEDMMRVLRTQAEANDSKVRVMHDLKEGCRGAEVVYAKSWCALGYYGRLEEEFELRQRYRNWMVTEEVLSKSNPGYFMHCLPVRRNVVVSDEVLDGPRSIVVDQAHNRLHLQKTLLSLLLRD